MVILSRLVKPEEPDKFAGFDEDGGLKEV